VKVLLDENMPHQLRAYLRHHEAATASYMGWAGWKNGLLLDAAEKAGFQVFVTGDLSLEYQQKLACRAIAVVSLSAQNWGVIKTHVDQIVAAIDGAGSRGITRVECGVFSRKHPKPKGPSLG
jgi:hypothetical protein